jgi:uncharacterized protein YbjT (DUF2867 family)
MHRILVTQATGRIGREVVPRLLARGCDVTAGTVEPHRAAVLFGDDAAVAELDFQRAGTYDAVVAEVDRILLVPPPLDPGADQDLAPFLERVAAAGARQVVLLSAMGLEWRAHVAVRRIEKMLLAGGVPTTFVRPNWYMQNFLAGYMAVPIRQADSFAVPVAHSPVSFVDVRDVADVLTEVLCGEPEDGSTWTLTGGEALTFDAAAAALSAALGREITYRSVSDDQMRQRLSYYGWPPERADVAMSLFRSMRNGERSAVTDAVETVLGRPPRDFASFARDHAGAFAP